MTIWGTCYFVSIARACRYYESQGYDANGVFGAVVEKIAAGEISIGRPEVAPGETLVLLDGRTRYGIEAADTPRAVQFRGGCV